MLDEKWINLMESMHVPNTYWKDKSEVYLYWMRALYERLTSTIEFTIPEHWDRQFFYFTLFTFGYCPVFETARWGVTFNPAYPVGYNWYYQPVYMQVSNPKLTRKYEIGKNCEVLRLTNDWHGVWDIIAHFSEQLASATKSINVALENSCMPYVLTAQTVAQAETLKKVKDKISNGESLIIYDNSDSPFTDEMVPQGDEPFQSFINDLKNNYMGTEILDNVDKILNQFYQEIGIMAQTTEHGKSHTLQDEVDQANEEATARLDTWMVNLKESCKRINAMFNIGLEVKRRECKITTGSDAQRNGSTEHSD